MEIQTPSANFARSPKHAAAKQCRARNARFRSGYAQTKVPLYENESRCRSDGRSFRLKTSRYFVQRRTETREQPGRRAVDGHRAMVFGRPKSRRARKILGRMSASILGDAASTFGLAQLYFVAQSNSETLTCPCLSISLLVSLTFSNDTTCLRN